MERNLRKTRVGVVVSDKMDKTEGVVAAAVEAVAVNAAEVADTGQSNVEQAVNELVHTLTTQGDLCADGHALAQFEVCNALLGLADNGLLAGDLAQVSDDSIDNLDVLFCLAGSHVDDDLIQLGNLHHALVAELFVQGRSDLIDILFFQTCHN